MPTETSSHDEPDRRMRGFERVAGLLQSRIRKVGEKRGFPITKLLTHWDEIVGRDVARIARPLKVSYSNGRLGATLTLQTPGPQAPILSMKLETIRAKVNACYGYSAISSIRISQTSAADFDRHVSDEPKPKPAPEIDPATRERVHRAVADVSDDGLRRALERFGEGVLANRNRK